MAAGFPVESSTGHKNKLKISALKMRHILKHVHAHASSLASELGSGRGLGKGTAPGKLSVITALVGPSPQRAPSMQR